MYKRIYEFINLLTCLAYILIYATAFCAFDDSQSNFDEDSFEGTILRIMVCVGVSFTLTLISYSSLKKRHFQPTPIQICGNLLPIPILLYGISSTNKIVRAAISRNDLITHFHCKAAIIISYIIIILLALVSLMTIYNIITTMLRKNMTVTSEHADIINITVSFPFHIIVIATLIMTVILFAVYIYGYVIVLFLIPFIVSFPLPFSIILATEIKVWIEHKKYFLSSLAYIIYSYLVYGALYRLFNSEIYGFATNHDIFDISFYNFILIVNVVIALVIAILLAIKGIKHLITQ